MAKVAIIMDEMFEDSEFRVPHDRVKEAGHEPIIVGLEKGKKLEGKKGKEVATTDVGIDEVSADDFDALVIPGGYSPDKIRTNEKMVELTRKMYEAGKPLAVICHGPWMLAEADIIRGKTVTSWPSLKTDLKNAGAEWVDQEVVEDGNIITSRNPGDLEAFSKALLVQIEQRS
jgi:protease I